MGKHAQESYVSTNFLTQANAASTYAPLASPTFTGTVTVPAPVNATDAVTKQYADAIAEGLHIHAAVGAATTTNINLSSPPATIDGVTLVDTMRVLVKDQNTTSENGIYVYNSASSSLTRALDFDTTAETDGGDFVFVTGGNTYDNTGWVQTETVTTIGTSPILFTQFSGAGTYTAGTGLSLNGTEFSNIGVVSLTGTSNEINVSASTGSVTLSLPDTINADTTGSAASLTTSRAISVTGDVSGSASFNGTTNASITTTLQNTGVAAASYGSASAVGTFTVDSKGRLTVASSEPIAISQSAVTNLTNDLAAKAPSASPTFTGIATFSQAPIIGTAGSPVTITVDGTIITQIRDTYSFDTGGNALQIRYAYGETIDPAYLAAAEGLTNGSEIQVFDGTSTYTFTATGAGFAGSSDDIVIPGSGTSSGYYYTGSSVTIPGVPAPTLVTNSFVSSELSNYLSLSSASTTYATLDSPALTGIPTAPTATLGTNTTQIATTEFVESRFDTTTINTQTASYGLVLADAGKTIEMNVGSANNLTVPLNSSQAFPVGTTIDVIQYGAGQTTIVATGGVTIRSKESKLKLTGQYSGATLYKRGTDEWVVVGDLTT